MIGPFPGSLLPLTHPSHGAVLLSVMCCWAGLCYQRAAPILLLLELSIRAQALSNCSHLFYIFTVWSVSYEAEVGLFAQCLFSEAEEF